MQLIDNAGDAWKMWSMRIYAIITAIGLFWSFLPQPVLDLIPPTAMLYIVGGLGALGALARVIKQFYPELTSQVPSDDSGK